MSDLGVRATPTGTLVDRALRLLTDQAADSLTLARDVLGIGQVTRAIADRVAVALLGADPRVRRLGDGRWALSSVRELAQPLASCTFAVVDIETTGSRPKRDRITELSVVTLASGKLEVAMDTLVNPERPIPPPVTSLTRITNEMVRDKPVFAEVADDVISMLAGRIFVAHNVRFDWSFLSREVRRSVDLSLEGPRLCTVQLTRRLVPGLRSRGLDSVAAYFGVEVTQRHRAGGDALATAQILRRLLAIADERGARTLEELRELGRPRRRRRTAMPTSMRNL